MVTPLSKFIDKCHTTLGRNDSREVNNAFDYLTERKLNKRTLTHHKIGYCPWDAKIPTAIKEIGKAPDSKRNVDYSYCIRGRIIVPIFSEFGIPVAFATRRPTFEQGYSWWNTPFTKGNHLFLLDKARRHVFDGNMIHIVEGYIDALMLWQEGLKTVVGLMGTKLTFRKVGLIARYCNNVCFCLDTDKNNSGQKAKNKSVAIMHKLSCYEDLASIDLPLPDDADSEDPANFVCQHGIDEYLKLQKTMPISEIRDICQKVQDEEA